MARNDNEKSLTARNNLYPYAQWYFATAIVTSWVGFSISYFMRLGQVTIYHHLHGFFAGMWMLVMIIEPILYQKNKIALHRKLGRFAAYVLTPLLVLSALKVVHLMVSHPESYPPGEIYPAIIHRYWLIDLIPVFLV